MLSRNTGLSSRARTFETVECLIAPSEWLQAAQRTEDLERARTVTLLKLLRLAFSRHRKRRFAPHYPSQPSRLDDRRSQKVEDKWGDYVALVPATSLWDAKPKQFPRPSNAQR